MSNVLEGSIKFPHGPRTSYGMKEWVTILAEMCKSGTSAADAVDTLKGDCKAVPTDKWFMDIMHTVNPRTMQKICRNLVSESASLAIRAGIYKDGRSGVMVGIDKHKKCRYDKNNMRYLIYSEPKNGTKRFEAYATMQIVDGPINATLQSVRVTRDMDNVDFIREFAHTIHNYDIRVRLALLDREFFAVDVMQAIIDAGLDYLMPAVKTIRIKKLIDEYHNGTGSQVIEHTIKNSRGEEHTFRLIIVKRDDKKKDKKASKNDDGNADSDPTDKYVVFATSLSAAQALREIEALPDDYRRRWGIETGYRQIDSVTPWTTSRDDRYRQFLFAAAIFMYNMWAIERARALEFHTKITLKMLARMVLAVARNLLPDAPDDDPGGGPDPCITQAARQGQTNVEEAATA